MATQQQEKQGKKPVTIYTEANPNPNSMKFVANFMLVEEGRSYDFPDAAAAGYAPLAAELFANFSFVERVFYMNNFVTVTKKETVDWADIRQQLMQFIKDYLEAGKPLLDMSQARESTVDETDSEVVKQIKEVLEEYIKPAVEMDGGAITFDSYKDGVVKVLLQGSCSGCPSSTVTLKAGIESLLKRAVPEIKTVEAVEV